MARKGKNKKTPSAKNLRRRWNKPPFWEWARYLITDLQIDRGHRVFDGLYDFRYCGIKGKIVHSMDISNSDLTRASFYKSDVSHSLFRDSKCIRTDFCESTVDHADFAGADLRGSRFCRASMIETDLSRTICVGTDFSDADVSAVNLDGANISRSIFTRCRNLESVQGIPARADQVVIDSETAKALEGTDFGRFLDSTGSINIVRKYDITISFAGEDRNLASQIAESLKVRNIGVFYDDYERVNLWGKNLYDHLSWVYKDAASFCIILISEYYKKKLWTNHERRSAQARAFIEQQEYILPLRLDNTEIPGVLDTTGYVDAKGYSVEQIVRMIVKKVRSSN